MNEAAVLSYLRRIGFEPPSTIDSIKTDEATLRALHRAHMASVPFENLDIHIGRPIVLDPAQLVAKIVDERRGGFCYELNGSFAELLTALGFSVGLLEARVHTDNGVGIRYDHLCLRVDLGQPFLVDVGFGDLFMEPIVLRNSVEQTESGHRFRIEPVSTSEQESSEELAEGSAAPSGQWLDLFKDDKPQYRFTPHEGSLIDYEPGCHHHQTSPESPFTQNTVCTRPTESGRVTLSGLTITETLAPPEGEAGAAASAAGETKTEIRPGQIAETLQSLFDISLGVGEARRLEAMRPPSPKPSSP